MIDAYFLTGYGPIHSCRNCGLKWISLSKRFLLQTSTTSFIYALFASHLVRPLTLGGCNPISMGYKSARLISLVLSADFEVLAPQGIQLELGQQSLICNSARKSCYISILQVDWPTAVNFPYSIAPQGSGLFDLYLKSLFHFDRYSNEFPILDLED